MVDEILIERVRRFVEEECRKPSANYSTAYDLHFISMHKIAKELAEKFGADVEIVEIAAWLHDIGSVVCGRENHHVSGAVIAEKKLRDLGYPEDKIGRVKECILNHRGSREDENRRISIESRIIAEADVLSTFDNVTKQFVVPLVHEGKSLAESKKSVLTKLKNKWNQLEFEGSRELVRSQFEAMLFLLEDGK